MRRSERGAATVEWLVAAMVIAIGGIALWQRMRSDVAETIQRGGDCIRALDGSCAPAHAGYSGHGGAGAVAPRASGIAPAAGGLGGAPIGSSSLTWGAPGFTEGWTPAAREQYLADHGVADPNVDYWTPFWEHGPPNVYTGTPDTGLRNQFAAIHDDNLARATWPWWADYFDVVTPLSGRTHDDIDAELARLGHALRHALGLE